MGHDRGQSAGWPLSFRPSPFSAWDRVRHVWTVVLRGRRFRLVREGLAYLAITLFIGSVAYLYEAQTLVMVFGMMCAPILLSGPLAFFNVHRTRPRRFLPTHAFAGEEFTVEIALVNRKRLFSSVAVVVEDSLRPAIRPFAPRVFFGRVPPGEQRTRRYRGLIPRRGRYQFGRLRLSTRFPFGFFERAFSFESPDSLIVYPRLGRIASRFYQMQPEFRRFLRGPQHRRTTYEEEYHGLREYRPGDSRRWIHWRTSARRGKLMVKEFERERSQNFVVLVDPWLPRRPSARDAVRVELAISFAATVVVDLCRRLSGQLLVAASGRKPWLLYGTGDQRLVHAVLARLADQAPTTGDETRGLFSHVDPRRYRDASVVVVSTRSLEPAALLPETDGQGARVFERLWSGRSAGRLFSILNVSAGDLDPLFTLE